MRNWRFSLAPEAKGPGLEEIVLTAESPADAVPPAFTVRFRPGRTGFMHIWNPFEERFSCSWSEQYSSFSSGLGVRANFDDSETNVLTFAVSDALNAIRFTQDHRETLLRGELVPQHPELGYPCVEATSDTERIVAVYQPTCVARIPKDARRTILVNATSASSLVIETAAGLRRVSVAPSGWVTLDESRSLAQK